MLRAVVWAQQPQEAEKAKRERGKKDQAADKDKD